MSHFSVAVILPSGQDPETDNEAEGLVEPLLAKYDENQEAPERQETCYCVGRVAKDDAELAASHLVASRAELRESFHQRSDVQLLTGKGSELTDAEEVKLEKLWEEHHAEFNRVREEVLALLPWKDTVNVNCDECSGTGVVTTTYNPDSKWDWYVVGGRWQQGFPNEKNIIRVRDLGDYRTFAFVTPDGQWHEKGKMGWWAMVSDRKPPEEWEGLWKQAITDFADHTAILVDAHI